MEADIKADPETSTEAGIEKDKRQDDRLLGVDRTNRPRRPFREASQNFDGSRKPFDSDRKPFREARQTFDGARQTFDDTSKTFADARKPFAEEGEFRRRRAPGPEYRQRELTDLKKLDSDILQLIAKRTGLVNKLRSRGRLNPQTEKEIRQAWQAKASSLCRDARLTRDVFAILQTLAPEDVNPEGPGFFNLAPPRLPVDVNIPGPADQETALYWMALAAASGQTMTLTGVPLSDAVVEAVKALNQLGGSLWWEEDGSVRNRGGQGFTGNLDKVVHVGENVNCLWLAIAFSLGRLNHLKITGGNALRFINLAPLRQFLPQLGARLTNIIPAEGGLPIRLECSGILPDSMLIPPDIPPAFVTALILASPFWEKPCRLIWAESAPCQTSFAQAAEAGLEILRPAKITATPDSLGLNTLPQTPDIPAQPILPLDNFMSAAFLALAGFGKGTVRLTGWWKENKKTAFLQDLLAMAGAKLKTDGNCITATYFTLGKSTDVLPKLVEYPEFFPLGATVAAQLAIAGHKTILPEADQDTAEALSDFLTCLGLELSPERRLQPIRELAPGNPPWPAPEAAWGTALALAAYLRPNLKLGNPGIVSKLCPSFWNIYNTLPKPTLAGKKREGSPDTLTDNLTDSQNVEPEPGTEPRSRAKRRIIAHGVYGELPSEAPARNDSPDNSNIDS